MRDRAERIISRRELLHGGAPIKALIDTHWHFDHADRDRVHKLKSGGKTLDEVVAANPTAEFDATWGKGFMNAKNFLGLVYNTL